MDSKYIIKYFAPFTIVVIIIIFILNVVPHGSIEHPGKSSYKDKCSGCHGDAGEGIRTLIPPLVSSDFALQNFDSIPCWLKTGLNRPITVNGIHYDQPMYGLDVDEIQIANLMNYIGTELLKSDKQEISSIQVKGKLKSCN